MPAGKKPISVWVNGMRFGSIAEAYAEINANTTKAKARAREAMNYGGTFRDHSGEEYILTLICPERAADLRRQPKPHRPGEPLIRYPRTSRLGYSEARSC